MLGLALLLGFHLLGMLLKLLLHIPLPPNVIGLILFTLSLFMKWVRLEWVEAPAQFLLKHMMLFFAPYIVGTIVFWPLIKQYSLSIIVSLVGGSFIVLMVTGWVSNLFGSRHSSVDHEKQISDSNRAVPDHSRSAGGAL